MESIRSWWREIAAGVAIFILRIASAPRTPWESDEFLFIESLRRFEPLRHHPHPPGFPLYVLTGKAVDLLVHDRFRSLVGIGIVSSVLAFAGLLLLFRELGAEPQIALAGAILVSCSAAMIVHAPLALSDGAAFACVLFALLAVARIRRGTSSATFQLQLWSSAAIGLRPQLVVPLAPVLLLALLQMSRRQKLAATAGFAVLSAIWFVPLAIAAGGLPNLAGYEMRQAGYVAAHDAFASRGAKHALEVAIRFLVHPWGDKSITLPVALLVLIGAITLVRDERRVRRLPALLPLLLFTIVQVIFEVLVMDPADAARYAIPSTALIGFGAAMGLATLQKLARVRWLAVAGAIAIALLSLRYVWVIVSTRSRQPSPPVAAASWIDHSFPQNTMVLYDAAMAPAVQFLLPRFPTASIDGGMSAIADRPDAPAVLIANGGSSAPDARVFSWPFSDAYGKLTRDLFRVVTVEPLPPGRRFIAGPGVNAPERTAAGESWRWLARDASVTLPRQHAGSVRLDLGLSRDAPWPSNGFHVRIAGAEVASGAVARGERREVIVAVPQSAAVTIEIVADRDFVPASAVGNRDARRLALQLIDLEQQPER